MILSLASFQTPKPARMVRLFFSDSRIIVAPMHCSRAGVYFEQSAPLVLKVPSAATEVGVAFRRGFNLFSMSNEDLTAMKKTDWPAFRASGMRSTKAFEQDYVTVLCESLNASDAVVRASVAHPADEGLEISASFNPLLAPDEIGKALLRLVNAARRCKLLCD